MATSRIKRSFRRSFFTGLIIVLPLLITFWVLQLLFGTIDRAITPHVFRLLRLVGFGEWLQEAWANWLAPVFSVVLAVLFIYFLGVFGGNMLGKQLLQALDRLLMQVPVVRGIYKATRQFLDTFSRGGTAFSRVVLVEYPRQGLWTLALVTSSTEGEVQRRTAKRVVSVFVPTTPNPTSGWLLFVPEDELVYLDMSVDDAFKMIISGGVLTPQQGSAAAASHTTAAPAPEA